MNADDPVGILSGVGPSFAQKLKSLGINTIEDLLLHVPSRHIDFRNKVAISELKIGEDVTIAGQVVSIDNVFTKNGKNIQLAKISDGEHEVDAIWMRQPYLPKILPPGSFISLSGKLSFWGKKRAFVFPVFEKFSEETIHTGRLVPVYPETAGVNSKWFRKKVAEVLHNTQLNDFVDESILGSFSFVNYQTALQKVHKPENIEDFAVGIKRLAFNELLLMQIQWAFKKLWWSENSKSHKLTLTESHLDQFIKSLPFSLTQSQVAAINEVRADIDKPVPMNRLLEGDVGSGKTVVAATGAYATFVNEKKAVFLAPTQILAQQHYETLTRVLGGFNARISLITSEGMVSGLGSHDIVVGTHALLYHEDIVKDAAFLVIDEQHRFGVGQRAKIAKLASRGKANPHILTMTATPIPRTIALTIYGDLELSTLHELPHGRLKTKTWVVPSSKRESAQKWIAEQIEKNGAQVFVVCPLIEESEAESLSTVKAATVEFKRLSKVFSKYSLALLHGRMKAKEKNQIISDFKDKKYDILVTTPVIEVGIDIADATIIVIEAAERFGLAQLHQLRGRVGRSAKQSYCLLFSDTKSKIAKKRLQALTKSTSGKELAEMDLEIRGPGEILGLRQHGAAELKIAHWNDYELIKLSRELAHEVVHDQEKYKKIISYYRKKQVSPN